MMAITAVYGVFAVRTGSALWSENLAAVANAGSRRFLETVTGLNHPLESAGLVLRSALVLGGACAFGIGAGALADRGRLSPLGRRALQTLSFALPFTLYALLDTKLPLRFLPLATLAALIGVVWVWWRQRPEPAELLPHLLLWAFTLGALARIPLRTIPHHYGFFLLPVPLVAVTVLLLRYASAVTASETARKIARLAGAGVLLGIVAGCVGRSAELYSQHTAILEAPRGRMLLSVDAGALDGLRLLRQLPGGSRVVVVPEGAGLIFFSGLEGGDGMFSYLPMELPAPIDDERLLSRWRARPPDAVLIMREQLFDFGYQGFGIDYAQKSIDWVAANYAPTGIANDFVLLRRAR